MPRPRSSDIATDAPLSTSMMNSVTKFESSWYLFLKSLSQGMSRTSAVGFGTETVIPETDTVVVPAPGFLYSSGS